MTKRSVRVLVCVGLGIAVAGLPLVSCTSNPAPQKDDRKSETTEQTQLAVKGGDGGDAGHLNDAGREAASEGGPGPNSGVIPWEVITHHNDNQRTGVQYYEQWITKANVGNVQFRAALHLDANPSTNPNNITYTQPLFARCVWAGASGGWVPAWSAVSCQDMLYVTNASGCVWAVDSHTGAPGQYQFNHYKKLCFANPYTAYDEGSGIMGTPVIDENNSLLYVVNKDASGSFTLYVVDVGAMQVVWSVAVAASVTTGSITNTFAGRYQRQRPALLMSADMKRLYVTFGNFTKQYCAEGCDNQHGWVLTYTISSDPWHVPPVRSGAYVTSRVADTPGSGVGNVGIWQAGAGPASDISGNFQDNVYVATANGKRDSSNDANRVVKLSTNGATLATFGAPYGADFLTATDLDFGTGGVIVAGNYLVSAGKSGVLYSITPSTMAMAGSVRGTSYKNYQYIDPSNCGSLYCDNTTNAPLSTTPGTGLHLCCPADPACGLSVPGCVMPNDPNPPWGTANLLQNPGCSPACGNSTNAYGWTSGIWSNSVFWNGYVYFWGDGDYLKRVSLNNSTGAFGSVETIGGLPGPNGTSIRVGSRGGADQIYEGQVHMSLSVNGASQPPDYGGTAILWAIITNVDPTCPKLGDPNCPIDNIGYLVAYDPLAASNPSSPPLPIRPLINTWIKARFSYPTIAKGSISVVSNDAGGGIPNLFMFW